MTKKNISPEAEIWLNEELKKYKNDIISRVPFIKDGHEITIQELIQAKCDLENYNSLYNIQIKNMIKKQRGLLSITIISILISFVSIIYYMIANNNSGTDIEHLTITMTGITFLVAMLTMMFALIIRNKSKHIPDKKMSIDIFMGLWHDFEWELKQKFTPKDTQKTSSWINVMQLYLRDFDNTYPQKAKDFYDVLNIRNKIVHGDINNVNNAEILDAIKIISKLTSEFKDK